MDALLDVMRREAERVGTNLAMPRMGTVTSYNPDTHHIKARLQPEGFETGWFPWAASIVGNGSGMFSPPSPGDQVVVIFQEGHGGSPIGVGAVYSDSARSVVEGAGGAPSGEVWLVHRGGARLRLLNDGSIEIRQQGGTQLVLKADGTIDLNAPTILIGAEGGTFRQLLDERFHAWATTHVHSNTGPPLTPPPLPESATVNLKGA